MLCLCCGYYSLTSSLWMHQLMKNSWCMRNGSYSQQAHPAPGLSLLLVPNRFSWVCRTCFDDARGKLLAIGLNLECSTTEMQSDYPLFQRHSKLRRLFKVEYASRTSSGLRYWGVTGSWDIIGWVGKMGVLIAAFNKYRYQFDKNQKQ